MKEFLKEIRNYEIKIRKKVRSQTSGEAKSPFKGSGLEFDEVRAYTYGDDVRAIDWKVSARTQTTHIKTFKEDKDQAVYFVVDTSASTRIGNTHSKKTQINRITGTLTLAAAEQNSQIGLILFSDEIEKIIKPNKGTKHAAQMVSALLKHIPKSKKTSLKKGLRATLGIVKKTSIVVVISDFLDSDYDRELKSLSKKHDLILINISGTTRTPKLGIVPIQNIETGKTSFINTSFGNARKSLISQHSEELKNLCHKNQIDFVSIGLDDDIISPISELFMKRNKKWKHA